MRSTLRLATIAALSVALWGFAIPAVAAAPTPVESAPRAFFNPDAVLDTSRIEDLRHVSAELSDMFAQELSWTDSVDLTQYGFGVEDPGPAERLGYALESQGWLIRWDIDADGDAVLLAFPPSNL